MSTSLSRTVVQQRTTCAVCSTSRVERVVELERLPLTGLFSPRPNDGEVRAFDQGLLVCTECGHGQLANQVDPEFLYDKTYSFRTSMSATARAGTDFFMSFLDKVAPGRKFRAVLDLGCNDLHLLDRLKDRVGVRVGIDPIWEGRESEAPDRSVTVIGSTIESVDLGSLPERPDLVVCRHTLEHIYNPAAVVKTLIDAAAPDALLVFEVPGFDALVRKMRFDHVFHQHLQYFNLASFRRLLGLTGGRYLASAENYHDWGAMAVAFDKKTYSNGSESPKEFTIPAIRERYDAFRSQLEATAAVLNTFKGRDVYGYGAGQMLPILAYHLGTDLSMLKAVLDDDPAKDGFYYQNLPLEIRMPRIVENFAEATVLLTAVDNAKPILTNLLSRNRPKHLLVPFHVI